MPTRSCEEIDNQKVLEILFSSGISASDAIASCPLWIKEEDKTEWEIDKYSYSEGLEFHYRFKNKEEMPKGLRIYPQFEWENFGMARTLDGFFPRPHKVLTGYYIEGIYDETPEKDNQSEKNVSDETGMPLEAIMEIIWE